MAALREVSDQAELQKLRNKMTEFLPQSVGIHGFLEMMLKSQLQDFTDIKVFIPDGTRPASLVVVTPSCSQDAIQSITVFWDTENEDNEDILCSLRSLPNWDWCAPIYYTVSPNSVYNKIQEFVQTGKLGDSHMYCHMALDGFLFSLDTSETPEFTIPEGFSLDSLRPENIPTITSPWQYKWTETQAGLASIVTKLPSVALRCQKESSLESNGPLVSWSFLYYIGFLGNTFTLPEYRRQGLGKAVTLAMADRLRKVGLPVRSAVDGSNTAAIRYHEKLGFTKKCQVKIFVMLPKSKEIKDYFK